MVHPPRDYQPHLDGLRAIAVLAVIVFHAGLGLPGGFVGVDAFFVISGYLILGQVWKALADGTWSLADFWRRRLRRIVPAVTVVTAVTLLASYWWMPPDALRKAAEIGLAQQVAAANVWLWFTANSYFAHENHWQPLLHLWSLGVEEQFYLVAPLLLWLLFRLGRKVAFAGLALAAAASFVTSIAITPTRPFDAFYLPHARLWELTLGGLFAIAVHEGWWPRLRAARGTFAVCGALLLVGSMVWFTERTAIPGAMAMLPCLGALLLIAAGQGDPDHAAARRLAHPLLRYVGLRSYSLYLWHWPCLVVLAMRCEDQVVAKVLAIAATFVGAELSYRFVEQPLRKAPSGDRLWRVLLATLLAGAALGLACYGLVTSGGAPERAPALYDHAPKPFQSGQPYDPTKRGWNLQHRTLSFFEVREVGRADRQPTDFVVFGDSHARFATRLFDDLGHELGARGLVVARFGVAPVAGAWQAQSGIPADHPGYAWSREGLEFVLAQQPRLVLLMARWAGYLRFWLDDNSLLVLGPRLTDGDEQAKAIAALGIGLREVVATLRSRGIAVAFVGQPPEQPNRHADLFRHLRFGYPQKPVGDAQWRLPASLQARLQQELGPASDAVRWLLPQLPESPSDLVFWDGAAVYWDEDHLSLHGMRKLLAEPCRNVLREVLQTPR
jgi:peptidoglycan/LPS O-acetylase OafA/YrhL